MNLYPAIDLMDGKCVRLTQGKRELCTVYSDKPEQMAIRWAREGAKWLHVIDLDAALDQKCFSNLEAAKAIFEASPGIRTQVGGGVRSAADVGRWLKEGASRVIVGTSVLESRDFAKGLFSEFGESVAVSIDSKGGKVALRGWTDESEIETIEACLRMRDDGAKLIILTDIVRDGMLTEPNFDMMSQAADALEIPVVCAGGVSLVEHVERLASLEKSNLDGAVIGRALYTGDFDLKAAVERFPQ
ncbi:MAG TPA: 1-(5-phosphoribosyl)-5-[(5-phosphoribosylamino)methylideneamino]imidazole-4-carboxamide isomerase [bacterium]|nr:1-(5-phosphoribosyl)-5-[(5-phosphoribosylamino)methylideneamino]imidazole-4-carboxamide isomerase [bacterium]